MVTVRVLKVRLMSGHFFLNFKVNSYGHQSRRRPWSFTTSYKNTWCRLFKGYIHQFYTLNYVYRLFGSTAACEKTRMKPFVAPEEAAYYLANCLK